MKRQLHLRMRGPIVAAALLLGSAIAAADDADMRRCRLLTEPAQRLSCYDGIELAPASAARQPGAVTDSFGVLKSGSAEIESIDSALVQELDGWRPNQVIALANGQSWQIVDGSSGYMRAALRKVRVRRGVLGTFYLEFEGVNSSPRVKRTQ